MEGHIWNINDVLTILAMKLPSTKPSRALFIAVLDYSFLSLKLNKADNLRFSLPQRHKALHKIVYFVIYQIIFERSKEKLTWYFLNIQFFKWECFYAQFHSRNKVTLLQFITSLFNFGLVSSRVLFLLVIVIVLFIIE